jgi:hypothetical protein
MQKYLVEIEARDYIRDERGVPMGDNAMKDHRAKGTGPKYTIINGRCLYTREWCDAWIEEQASRPLPKRRRHDEQSAA